MHRPPASAPQRPRPEPAGRGAAILLALVALAMTAPASGDYRQSYLDGRKALRAGDLNAATAAFLAAIAEEPTERAKARLVGMIPEPYLPHHYLGLAHFGARRCPEAVAEWRLSANQGALATLPAESTEARKLRGYCDLLAQAEAAVADAHRAASSATKPPASALADLARVDHRLAEARAAWNFDTIAETAESARGAASTLEAWLTRQQQEHSQLTAITPPPDPATDTHAGTAPPPRAAATPQAPPQPAAAGGTIVPDPFATPIPLTIVKAIQSYFDGNYQECADRLRGFSSAPGTRAHFLQSLFRGAALQALYWLGDEHDVALLTEAREDLRAARRADPRFAPTKADFSPRFVEAYQSVR